MKAEISEIDARLLALAQEFDEFNAQFHQEMEKAKKYDGFRGFFRYIVRPGVSQQEMQSIMTRSKSLIAAIHEIQETVELLAILRPGVYPLSPFGGVQSTPQGDFLIHYIFSFGDHIPTLVRRAQDVYAVERDFGAPVVEFYEEKGPLLMMPKDFPIAEISFKDEKQKGGINMKLWNPSLSPVPQKLIRPAMLDQMRFNEA